ncbi:hypothetical protein OG824_08280 [Streptomyces prunicolor]|uniref:hypothetical protein n=1 Tax=Streptomyces prunicolor TaxID=67348 RepID=UPI0022567AF5|nr:hypothetical protein [Streptomyces prunicolor]MCX5235223.1 hypothetical protein [Streptomyces prunicolor]
MVSSAAELPTLAPPAAADSSAVPVLVPTAITPAAAPVTAAPRPPISAPAVKPSG